MNTTPARTSTFDSVTSMRLTLSQPRESSSRGQVGKSISTHFFLQRFRSVGDYAAEFIKSDSRLMEKIVAIGDVVRINDLDEETLMSEGRLAGIVVGLDSYNPPREMRESRSHMRGLRGEKIVRVLWSGTQTTGWILQKRLEVIGMQIEQ